MSSMVLDGVAARSRRTDPVTSVDAGRSVDLPGSQAAVMFGLTYLGPSADFELARSQVVGEYGYTEQRLRSARAELVEQGVVEFSGIYRLTPRGNRTKVWQVVPD